MSSARWQLWMPSVARAWAVGGGVGFYFVCKAFLITLLEQRRRHFTEREKGVREGAKEKKKKNPLAPKTFRKPNKCQNGGHLCQLLSQGEGVAEAEEGSG